jgi:hypothetical protein
MSGEMELRKGKRVQGPLDPMLAAMVEDVYTVKVNGALGVRADTKKGCKIPTLEITSTDQGAIDRVVAALKGAHTKGLAVTVQKIKTPSKETLKRLLAEQSQKVDGLLE